MHLNMNLIVCLFHSPVDILKHKDHLLNSMLYPFMLFMANELMKCEERRDIPSPEMSFRSQEVNASVIQCYKLRSISRWITVNAEEEKNLESFISFLISFK